MSETQYFSFIFNKAKIGLCAAAVCPKCRIRLVILRVYVQFKYCNKLLICKDKMKKKEGQMQRCNDATTFIQRIIERYIGKQARNNRTNSSFGSVHAIQVVKLALELDEESVCFIVTLSFSRVICVHSHCFCSNQQKIEKVSWRTVKIFLLLAEQSCVCDS